MPLLAASFSAPRPLRQIVGLATWRKSIHVLGEEEFMVQVHIRLALGTCHSRLRYARPFRYPTVAKDEELKKELKNDYYNVNSKKQIYIWVW